MTNLSAGAKVNAEGLSCHLNAVCTALDDEEMVQDCKSQGNAHDRIEAGEKKDLFLSLFPTLY